MGLAGRPAGPAAGRLPAEFVRLVRERTDIVEVIGERVALRPAGRELVGLCPFHEEKTPSFSVSRERQLYHCHGCHAGGDAITFVMQTRGVPFADAVAELAARAGLRLPAARPLSAGERRRLAEREELLAACEAAAAFFRDCLRSPRGAEAIAYLRRRGVDGRTAERFDLGFAPPGWTALVEALSARFAPEVLVRAGLAVAREGDAGDRGGPREAARDAGRAGLGVHDRFRGRLTFPIADERGRVIAFGGRALDAAERAKYVNSPETPLFAKRRVLYALHLARPAARRAGRVLVVEGYMDALTCHQFGFAETVAALGTGLSPEQAGMLAACAECIVLGYDADAAGDAATERGLGVLQERGARVEVLRLPRGLDPDAWLRGQGREPFARALERPEPLVPFLLRSLRDKEPEAAPTPERRWMIAQRLLPYLRRLPAAPRQEYTEWVARELLLPREALARSLDTLAERRGEHRNSNRWEPRAARPRGPAGGAPVARGSEAAEGALLAACLVSAGALRRAASRLSIHEFRDPAHRALVPRLLALAAAPPTAAEAEGAPARDAASGPQGGLTADGGAGLAGGGAAADEGSGGGVDGVARAGVHGAGARATRAAGGVPAAPAGAPEGEGRSPGERLLDELEEAEERAAVARLLARPLPGDPVRLAEQSLLLLERAALVREHRELREALARLTEAGHGLDAPETRRVLERRTEVGRALASVASRLAELTAAQAVAARELDD